jgi:hypothetical protein
MAEFIPRSRASVPRSQSAVGPGIGTLKAEEARAVLEDAPVYAASQDPEKTYPFEALNSPVILKEVKDLWLQVGLLSHIDHNVHELTEQETGKHRADLHAFGTACPTRCGRPS